MNNTVVSLCVYFWLSEHFCQSSPNVKKLNNVQTNIPTWAVRNQMYGTSVVRHCLVRFLMHDYDAGFWLKWPLSVLYFG